MTIEATSSCNPYHVLAYVLTPIPVIGHAVYGILLKQSEKSFSAYTTVQFNNMALEIDKKPPAPVDYPRHIEAISFIKNIFTVSLVRDLFCLAGLITLAALGVLSPVAIVTGIVLTIAIIFSIMEIRRATKILNEISEISQPQAPTEAPLQQR